MFRILLSQKWRSGYPLLLAAISLAAGCSASSSPPPADLVGELAPIPPVGTPGTLDVATWNLEWFGDGGNGPEDDVRQQENILTAMRSLEVDLWAVEEVVSSSAFADLVDRMDGWEGFLANDPAVQDGPTFYNDFGGNEQKVGVIYRSDLLELSDARVILTEFDHEFAGRPPLEVRFRVQGPAAEVKVIVLHAKAGATEEDRVRREGGARALKALIDRSYPSDAVLVIGDFNDDLDRSIADGAVSPYAGFRADAGGYFLPTLALSEEGTASMVRYPDPVDHQIGTSELEPLYVDGSARVIRLDQWIPGYGDTTSDHFPALVQFSIR